MNPYKLPQNFNNAAFEMITHNGQHIKTYNLPDFVNGNFEFGQLTHSTTFYQILNKLFSLDIPMETLSMSFELEVKSSLEERKIFVDSIPYYSSPEICISHHNELANHSILIYIPAFITTLQYNELLKLRDYYNQFIIGVVHEFPIIFIISGWNPMKNIYKEKPLYPKSFDEAIELLEFDHRIKDYQLPFNEYEFKYDIPLELVSNKKFFR